MNLFFTGCRTEKFLPQGFSPVHAGTLQQKQSLELMRNLPSPWRPCAGTPGGSLGQQDGHSTAQQFPQEACGACLHAEKKKLKPCLSVSALELLTCCRRLCEVNLPLLETINEPEDTKHTQPPSGTEAARRSPRSHHPRGFPLVSSGQLLPGTKQHSSPLEKSASPASLVQKGWTPLSGGGDNLPE